MPAYRKSSGLARVGLVAVACVAGSQLAFTGVPSSRAVGSRIVLNAEGAPAPAPAPEKSSALVKVTEENVLTTAGVLSGIVGLLVGGIPVSLALFAATSFFVRRDDDVAKALRGVAQGSLEALNFGSDLNERYEVTDKVGKQLDTVVSNAKLDKDNKATIESVEGFAKTVSDGVAGVDKDIGIKDTVGSLLTSAGDIANQAVEKAADLNSEYKITEQIAEKVTEATKDVTGKSK